MRTAKTFSLFLLMLALYTLPTFAQTTIYSPANGSTVSSPFTLNMYASSCSSKPIAAVGYSLDNSSQTSAWSDNHINGPVTAPSGWHTLHVKVWNNVGNVCVTDLSLNIVSGGTTTNTSSGGGASIPSYATHVSSIQALNSWIGVHDTGTPGGSSGTMSMHSSPSLTGASRLFANSFWGYGGERYSIHFDDNQTATNLVYDTWVYIANDSNGFANLELDLNQTLSNGITVIMGFQCDTWSGTWDYTVNAGSPTSPVDRWVHSSQGCNVHNWAPNKWHHVQIYYSHDSSGWVTYHTVWLDGVAQNLNVTAFSGFSLHWGPAIIANFQIDGNKSGTTWGNIYMDEMTVYHW